MERKLEQQVDGLHWRARQLLTQADISAGKGHPSFALQLRLSAGVLQAKARRLMAEALGQLEEREVEVGCFELQPIAEPVGREAVAV